MIKKLCVALVLFLILPVSFGMAQVSGTMLEYPPRAEDVPGLMVLKGELGADIKYIGRRYSVDMWLATKDNASQIIYTTLDGRGLLTNGFLFDPDGNVVTEKQMADVNLDEPSIIEDSVREYQDMLKAMKDDMPVSTRLWNGLSSLRYIGFGDERAPVLYLIADSRCPYCKKYWNELAPYVDKGQLQVRVILVGILGDQSVKLGSQIISEIDKQGAWIKTANGTYPYDQSKIDEKGMDVILENTLMMKEWEMESVPFSIYKDKFGKVMMLRGYVQDVQSIIDQVTR